jgi:spermidine/putrescine transport system permease protein
VSLRGSRRFQVAALLGPGTVWTLAFVALPGLVVLVMSFWRVENYQVIPDVNLDAYVRIFNRPVYLDVMRKSLGIALVVATLTLMLAIPLAYMIAFKVKTNRVIWYGLIVMSLWVGYLLRAYAWRIILGSNGILNGFLADVGIVREPLAFLLFSPFAVVLTLTHLCLPFALIPIFSAMEQVPKALGEAASDLGAGPLRSFWHVMLPLTAHGILAGGSFAFILSFGDFLAPVLVGGPDGVMISNIAAGQFGAALQWPLGSAIAVIMFVVVITVLAAPSVLSRWLWRGTPRSAAARAIVPATDVQ